MIERYEVKEIVEIWSDQNRFEFFLKVEIALLKALEGKKIPVGTAKHFQDLKVSQQRIKEIEKVTKHDIIAFCTSLTEQVPPEVSKYFHYGCTSSDIIDTALSLQLKESSEFIMNELQLLLDNLKSIALKHKNTLCLGRSHGMNAEPMSFGSKFLGFYSEFKRRYNDLNQFIQNDLTGQFSGAVGNYTILTPEIEEEALKSLGLATEPISTQVIPRDRISKLISITSMIANAIERLAVEIRLLHHSDINELYEGFSSGQKGSSAMPHKKNPISGENLSGIARVIRSHLTVAQENSILWHERDISHSSSERLILPDNLGLCAYAIKRLSNTVQNLYINSEKIEDKVLSTHTYLSSYILHQLIDTTDLSREKLYAIVQEISFTCTTAAQIKRALEGKEELSEIDFSYLDNLNLKKLKSIFLRNIDTVFSRIL